MKKNFKESSKSGAVAWLLQRISAVVLFVILLVHFVTYHFISTGAAKYSDIAAKMQSPWFNMVQFLFLVTALYHGLNGVWMVVEDYIHAKGWRLFIFSLLVLGGIGLLFVGSLTIVKISGAKLGA
ncbi:MAG: succinate dehydrogenase, hydrophobic membrane anchor protein [bacterium]|nr:succinate dehydrogenase, hydrophobic membrane anchor protein [bacterium]